MYKNVYICDVIFTFLIGQQLHLQCLADLNSQGRPAKSEQASKRDSDPQDLLNLLFERGPDFVLIEAAKSGDEEIVKLLIDNEEVIVNAKDDYGYTALCYAALKGLKLSFLFLIH